MLLTPVSSRLLFLLFRQELDTRYPKIAAATHRHPDFGPLLRRVWDNEAGLDDADFTGMNVGDDMLEWVALALKNNNQVKTLWLGNNFICRRGLLFLAELLKTNSTIQVLVLDRNIIGNEVRAGPHICLAL